MRVLTFAAVLTDEGLELQPGFVVEGEPSREEGELSVEALARGRPLATTMLPLHAPCGPPGGEDHHAAFGLVAFPERATGLRVSLGDRVLLEQTAPPDKLEVEVEWPGTLARPEAVRWRASTADCIASLGYSNDDGETWTPIALPGPSGSIEVDATSLPGGPDCVLELVVTDGFHTRRVCSDTYEVKTKGWVLWILSPAPGARLPAGERVLLAAQGYHFEERRAGLDDIAWESSTGGRLGAGARVFAVLEPGEQTITARMYDVIAEAPVSVE